MAKLSMSLDSLIKTIEDMDESEALYINDVIFTKEKGKVWLFCDRTQKVSKKN